MDLVRKRVIRVTVALTVALILFGALVSTSFVVDRGELTASQLLKHAQPGHTYILAGTVMDGSISRSGGVLTFRVRDPKLHVSVPVHYTGEIPDPFANGRVVLVDVQKAGATGFVSQPGSLTTRLLPAYQTASGTS
jgi:cytochrome c-type biogenesis protein CcmE